MIARVSNLREVYSFIIVGKEGLSEQIVYENIVLHVEAPAGAFPEGTELRITPITQEKQKEEIREGLKGTTKVAPDSSMVSFDISFIGLDENGNEVELKPAEGKQVRLSFNYVHNDDFVGAEEESKDKELKIYHIEGVSKEDSVKCEKLQVSEVKIDRYESENGELVAYATDFSIYTIASEESEEGERGVHMMRDGLICGDGEHEEAGECVGNTKTVTCLTGDATVIYDVQEVTVNYDTELDDREEIPTCNTLGFVDEYHAKPANILSESTVSRYAIMSYNKNISYALNIDGTSEFMHYETTGGVGTISVCDPEDDSKCITMMDMNLGATTSGTTCSSGDTGACGNHYQWGNNYGFVNPGQNSSTVGITRVLGAIDTEGYGPGNYFSSGIFRRITSDPYDWSSPKNDNLRGGSGDSESENDRGYPLTLQEAENRRGPCDTGYHVPSQGERGTLLEYWSANYMETPGNTMNDAATIQFNKDFKIPLAGYRVRNQGWTLAVETAAYLWSSSPDGTNARYITISSSITNGSFSRASAFSVRCFKDSHLSFACQDGEHKEDGVCTGNTQTVTCIAGNATGVEYNVHQVTITYDTGTKTWETTPACEISGCIDGYHAKSSDILSENTFSGNTVSGYVVHYDNNISYTGNEGTPTEQFFTGVGTITITDGVRDPITILDRNLGATEAGTGCDKITNGGNYCVGGELDPTYGYHFQWGNNYGFRPCSNLNQCSDSITSSAVQGQVDATTIIYDPFNQEYYSSGVFYKGYTNWLNDNNKYDLRGGSTVANDFNSSYPLTAESASARRGPCPEGFHVPSVGEFEEINTMLGSVSNVHNYLLVPFAGYRKYDDVEVYYLGDSARLWSSSPGNNYASRNFAMNVDGVTNTIGVTARAQGFSVRCIQDSYERYVDHSNFSCEEHQKIGACTSKGIANAVDIVTDVTWTRNTVYDKRDIPQCDWYCPAGYHTGLDNNSCESNSKYVPCIEASAPANAEYITGDVEITYDTSTSTRSATGNCSWMCTTGYHTEDGDTCTGNDKRVSCRESGGPANSVYTPGSVPVIWVGTWNIGNWSTADVCQWTCDSGYHTEDGDTCTGNSKYVSCTQSGAPAGHSNYLPGDVQVTWSGTWDTGEWTIADACEWSCNPGYHLEDGICTGNTKTVQCTQSGAPAEHSAYILGEVQITWIGEWNNGSWPTADACEWSCNPGYHLENGICTGNTKTVSCTESGKPNNSTYIPGNVQITWIGEWNNGSWPTADNCDWRCNSNYHTEDGETCRFNDDYVACTESGKPSNSTYISGNVRITWSGEWNDGSWPTADNCAWSCDDGYHTEDNLSCISNSKDVACTESGKPENSYYNSGNVGVTWSGTWDTGEWTTPANCTWSCNDDFHKVGNSCVSNNGTAQCNTGTTPANATPTIINVPITWNGIGWTEPANCAWSCDDGYHTEDNLSCISNSKDVACTESGKPENSYYNSGNVGVTWSGTWDTGEWTEPANCAWSCNDDYHTGFNVLSESAVGGYVAIHYDNNISYILNSGFDTQDTFTGVGTITITDGINTITILDRNLGAEVAGTGSESYGSYFQWGNNYGFPNNLDGGAIGKVDASNYGPGNYYSNSTFYAGYPNWSNIRNDNLWGGVSGTVEAMQGPCPEGYHVPSSGEWLALANMLGYDGTATGTDSLLAIDRLKNNLLIPMAGRRDYSSSAKVRNQGTDADYWSSTPYSSDRAYGLDIDSIGLKPQDGYFRSYGFSVRCFANSNSQSSSGNISCQQNQRSGSCTEKGGANVVYDTSDVTWTRNTGTNKRDIPECEWYCPADYHTGSDNNSCESNTKQEACIQSGEIPANSHYDVRNVTGIWNDLTSGWDIPNCDWNCSTGYHTEDGETCTGNTKEVSCTESGAVDNSSYITGNVTITWSGTWDTGEWTQARNCAWSCDDDYHQSGVVALSETIGSGYTVTHYDSNISYILNSGFGTQKLFTGVGTITVTNGEDTITILDRNLGAAQALSAGGDCGDYEEFMMEYACSLGREDEGWESYEECYSECISSRGTPEKYCQNYCSGDDMHGYDTYDDCWNGGENAYYLCTAGSHAYGYHFQWGNNYGFAPNFDGSDEFPNGETVDYDQIDCGPYSPSTPLDSSTFIVEWYDYCTGQNDNLRGGSGDSEDNNRGYPLTMEQAENRRGPCPEGYHVPSIGEWEKLFYILGVDVDYYTLASQGDYSDEIGYLQIPFDGFRNYLGYSEAVGEVELWSSSPDGAYARALYFSNGYTHKVIVGDSYRAQGNSVRCFADSSSPEVSCELNQISGDCAETGAIENTIYNTGTTTWTWNTGEHKRDIPACSWSCDSGYHLEDGICTGNTQTVPCVESGAPAENSSYTTGNVQITWSGTWDTGEWTPAANCAWSCNDDYHTEDGETCTGNTKQVACTQSGEIPANSVYNVTYVTGTWNSGTESWDIPNCDWMCSLVGEQPQNSHNTNITWNNDNLLNSSFWSQNPSDEDIIDALYGSEGDSTAYTLGWPSTCTGMSVVHVATTNGLPTTLSANTIYVLDTDKIIKDEQINMSNCSAIVSSLGTKTTFYSPATISTNYLMNSSKSNCILDNIDIDGGGNGNGGTHSYNTNVGIGLNRGTYNTINNVSVYRFQNPGINLDNQSKYNKLNNITTYDNGERVNRGPGIHIAASDYNYISNFVSYSNRDSGISPTYQSDHNVFCSGKVYNNGRFGVFFYSSPTNNILINVNSSQSNYGGSSNYYYGTRTLPSLTLYQVKTGSVGKCSINYDSTSQGIMATLVGCQATNNSGSNTYLFTGDGSFTFEYVGESDFSFNFDDMIDYCIGGVSTGTITATVNYGYHTEDGLSCTRNTQTAACTESGAVDNSSYITGNVEITWSGARNTGEWIEPANCSWSCNDGYHTEDNESCIENTKTGLCAIGGIENAVYYNEEETTWTRNTGDHKRDIPECRWTCDTGYHTEDGETCTSNTKQVACIQSGEIPANSSYYVTYVTGTRNSGTESWDIPNCDWNCSYGYHTEDGESCTGDTKQVPCTESGAVDNSSYITGNVQITWSGTWDTGEWTQARNCAWSCDEDYHRSGATVLSENISDGYTVTHYDSNISYILNSGFSTQKLFTGVGTITVTNGEDSITILDRNLGAAQALSAGGDCDYEEFEMEYVCSEGRENDGWESYEQCYNEEISRGYTEEFAEKYCSGYLHGYETAQECWDGLYNAYDQCRAGLYGYHFQWGNNYGFAPSNDGAYYFPNGETVGYDQIDCGPYSPSTPLDSSTFIVGWDDYCTGQNDNLRGGSGDNEDNGRGYPLTMEQAENRRGPCPEGYHVPSIGEWEKLFNILGEDVSFYDYNYNPKKKHRGISSINHITLASQGDYSDEIGYLQIGPAGYSDYNYGAVHDLGSSANLWSSSPIGEVAGYFYTDGGYEASIGDRSRADAHSVRCFADTPSPFGNASCELNQISGDCIETGGENVVYDTGNYTWTRNTGTNGRDIPECIWYCPVGYHTGLDDNSCEINTYTVRWYDRDGTLLETDTGVVHGTMPNYDGVTPTSGSDEGYHYNFVGWSPATGLVTGDTDYTATYESIAIPHISFTGDTPASGTILTQNRFPTKMDISNIDNIKSMTYQYNGSTYDLMSGLVLMYNFDNVAALGESSTVVKDLSNSRNDGVVDGATWTDNGKYGGAYSFDGDDYIGFTGLSLSDYSIVLWTKTAQGPWTHIVITTGSIYVDGISSGISNIRVDIGNGYIGRVDSSYYEGIIDEIRVYDHALSSDEIQFLYKSNLSKTSEKTWEFDTLNTCLDATGTYIYSGEVVSYVNTQAATDRSLTTDIPLVSVDGTGYDFGTHTVSGLQQILSGTMGTLTVTDYRGKSGWKVYFTTSPTLIGANTSQTIDTNALKFKATNLTYNGLYDGEVNTHVYFGNGISTTQFTTAHGSAESDNILEYIVRTGDVNDFMCGDVGEYSDTTEIELTVPAWQVEDTYTGTLWVTLQQN